MKFYKALSKQIYKVDDFSIVPIRFEDRLKIMQWRNEQIYHLRQVRPLTAEDQNTYFNDVVSKLFDQEQPNQILFSFLKGERCIGYGGLVHINWIDLHAEISFIMDTSLEKGNFKEFWSTFLILLEEVAFKDVKLHKINTYAYDIRPHLYHIFESNGFNNDAILRDHKIINGTYVNVVIHSKLNQYVY
jgi:RimJ/RimL family protein N-acetyltransferase